MYLVLLAAALAILAGVIVVAMGQGGELVRFDRDLPAVPPRIRTAADVAMLRLPLGLFGYRQHAADAAFDAAARLLAERDAELAVLRAELRRLGAQRAGAAGADQDNGEPAVPDQEAVNADAMRAGAAGSGAAGSDRADSGAAGPNGAAGGEIVSTRVQSGGQP